MAEERDPHNGLASGREPYSDPHTGEPEPHDVLAADEFAMPTRDHRHPPDPHTGEHEAHEVLAAEEFAMPGGSDVHRSGGAGMDPRSLVVPLLAALLALVILRRRRS
jgi:hypothetical protein